MLLICYYIISWSVSKFKKRLYKCNLWKYIEIFPASVLKKLLFSYIMCEYVFTCRENGASFSNKKVNCKNYVHKQNLWIISNKLGNY